MLFLEQNFNVYDERETLAPYQNFNVYVDRETSALDQKLFSLPDTLSNPSQYWALPDKQKLEGKELIKTKVEFGNILKHAVV